jgi:hypothetical protein
MTQPQIVTIHRNEKNELFATEREAHPEVDADTIREGFYRFLDGRSVCFVTYGGDE